MPEPLTFIVATSFRLPGLGVLVLPILPEPSWLALYPLYTSLTITLPHDNLSFTAPLTATIEEIQHDNSPLRRALLLDLDMSVTLLEDTQLIISKTDSYLE